MKLARSTEANGTVHGVQPTQAMDAPDARSPGARPRPRRRHLMAAGLAVAVVLVAAAPASAVTMRFKLSGQEAVAAFSSTDSTGCILSHVLVAALDDELKAPSRPAEPDSRSMAIVSRYDRCTHTALLDAYGEVSLPADAFVISPLESATLNTMIPVVDYVSGNSLVLTVDLTWTAEGGSSRVRDHYQVKSPTFTVNAKFTGISQEATANGTVSDGLTNLTPAPADFALLNSVKVGVLEVTR